MRRRSFMTRLAGLGATAAIPTLGTFRDAAAGGEVAPLRLLLWYQPNGYGQDPGAVHARSLETMAPLRHKITYLRGMHLPTADGGHEYPMETMLTGPDGGTSFDQVLAPALSEGSVVDSLMLGVRSEQGGFGGHCSFLADGDPTPRIETPQTTWGTVFAGLDTGEDPEAQAALQGLWARRDVIMTRNQQAAEALRSRLSSTQRERLDQYISSIDAIRDEMTSATDTPDVCVIPPEPMATPDNAWNEFYNYEGIASGQISMMAHALACDLTRVGLVQFNRATSQVPFSHVLGQAQMDQHHALTHLPDNETAQAELADIHDWYDARFLELLQALEARTDIDGGTVLDNTIVVRVTECMLSNGHEFDEGHHLIAGGGNHITSGADLVVSNDDPLSKLWLTLAHALGQPLPSLAGYEGDVYGELLG